jgi:hypothetical protein
MSADQAREIAERVARRVGGAAATPQDTNRSDLGSELAAVRVVLDQLQQKLVQIEAKVGSGTASAEVPAAPRVHSPWLAGVNADANVNAGHPSIERFGVEEATVSELVDFFQNEKACSLEPGGKPCDHCAMCSSRGC